MWYTVILAGIYCNLGRVRRPAKALSYFRDHQCCVVASNFKCPSELSKIQSKQNEEKNKKMGHVIFDADADETERRRYCNLE